jgi:hypothetical protein
MGTKILIFNIVADTGCPIISAGTLLALPIDMKHPVYSIVMNNGFNGNKFNKTLEGRLRAIFV